MTTQDQVYTPTRVARSSLWAEGALLVLLLVGLFACGFIIITGLLGAVQS